MGTLGFRVISALHRTLYRATRGRLLGRFGKLDVLLLTTTGRVTGKPRTVPLLFADVDGSFVLIASKGGAPADPAWCRNLRANPDAIVERRGRRIPVHAHEADGDERDRLWAAMVAGYKGYDAYQARTARRIPVVVLEPRTPA